MWKRDGARRVRWRGKSGTVCSELFYEQLREAKYVYELMARRAPSVGGVGDKSTDDSVRSPSTRSYLPEVNFLLCGEGSFPVGFAILAPLGRSLSLSSLSLSKIALSLATLALLGDFATFSRWELPSSVGLINSVVATMWFGYRRKLELYSAFCDSNSRGFPDVQYIIRCVRIKITRTTHDILNFRLRW